MKARGFDVIVVGGGAAGLFAAAEAGRRGRRVRVLEHNAEVGRKILVSGGGRCNFTHLDTNPCHFVSANPHFCKSALARFTPRDFVAKVEAHGIAYHEKSPGQLFCDGSARQIVRLLVDECRAAGVEITTGCRVSELRGAGGRFEVETSTGPLTAAALVVATGGLSIPTLGASDLGYRIATQFGLRLEPTRPALVPLVFEEEERRGLASLAGVALECVVSVGRARFRERLLFTHRGLSGPAVLQASSYWRDGEALRVNLLPDVDAAALLRERRAAGSRALPSAALAEHLPARLAEAWCERHAPRKPASQLSDREIGALAHVVHDWRVVPAASAGYGKAEVTAGGVSTAELSSRTLEALAVPGLYFVGEVVDVTGWLGGFNFQWAWASAHAAGQAV
jgi:predicted Rossmann fold flavoprotein